MLDNLPRSQKQQISKISKYLGVAVLVIAFLYFLSNNLNSSSSANTGSSSSASNLNEALATAPVNRQFQIPLTDKDGNEIATATFDIQDVEVRNEILVKGSKAIAAAGREFLIVNFKVTNQSQTGINVNTRNYLRLSVNGNDSEWLAPDIHNDPVEVQAISTKRTRVGFFINSTDTNLKLQFGDIRSNKEIIELTVK